MWSLTIASATATGIEIAASGIAVVLLISAIFYVVGRGEDRDRARAARELAALEEEQRRAAAPGERAPASRLPKRARTRRRP